MPNLLETVSNLMKSITEDKVKPPLHVGEVMGCWTYLALIAEAKTLEKIALNTTTDPELREILEKAIKGANSRKKRLTDFLLNEGVSLPPVSETKPLSEPNAIPLGVKLTDNEIANMLSFYIATAIVTCANIVAQSIRNDVGLIFVNIQGEVLTLGMPLKTLMKKRDWLKTPPYYYPPGLPNQ